MLKLEIDHTVKRVVLTVAVSHYDNNDNQLSTIKDVRVKLVADNTTKVNTSGEIVERKLPDGSDNPSWSTAIGEYDFLEQFPTSGNSLSNVLYPVIEQYIAITDSRGRFNKNIYK